MSTQRKVFHCAVDDTALTTNISEIKKWMRNGAITLIVPLYTLERLHALKSSPIQQVAINANEAVKFLDRVTSGKDPIPIHKVALQGPQEQYDNWAEVEQFVLPEYVEEGQQEAVEEVEDNIISSLPETQNLLAKLNFKTDGDIDSLKSANSHHSHHVSISSSATQSSKTSPEVTTAKLLEAHNILEIAYGAGPSANGNAATSVSLPVPTDLRPLLNSMVWRLHNTDDTSDEMINCILITNDNTIQGWAQKLGITVKSINKLRQSIIYEDKELKNRVKFLEKVQPENGLLKEPGPTLKYEESDEEVVVVQNRGRGHRGSMRGGRAGRRPTSNGYAFPAIPAPDVPTQPIDPDSFSRSANLIKSAKAEKVAVPTPSPRPTQPNYRAYRSRGAFGGTARGKGKLWVPST